MSPDGTERHRREIPNADCPGCDDDFVLESPEAGYATCHNCGERGYRCGDTVDWWRNDPDSQWYVEPEPERDRAQIDPLQMIVGMIIVAIAFYAFLVLFGVTAP